MALEVEIMNVDESGATLDVGVAVTVDDTESVDYELNINDTGTGGNATRSGSLAGGGGSYPGDSNVEEASFGIGDTTGGTVTAVITAPDRYVGPEYQSQEKWGDSGDGPVEDPTVEVNNCDPQPTSNGDLDVSYTLAPTDDSSGDVGITIRVDGQRVGYENHYVPARGGSFSQTIPSDRLPTGTDMPVEVGVGGDFSECGTVTVGGAADGSIRITDATATGSGTSLTVTATLTGTAPAGDVLLSVSSDRAGFGFNGTVDVPSDLSDTTVEITGEPGWEAGDHTVTVETSVADASGDVLAVDTQQAGSVTLSGSDGEQSRTCEGLVAEYGDVIAEYANDSGRVTEAAARQANEDLMADEIILGEARAVAEAYRNGCQVEPQSNRSLALLGAAGVAAVGIGYAVTRD